MAQVLDFDPARAAAPPSPTPPHRRIRWASRALSVLFGVIFVVDVVFLIFLALAFATPMAGDRLLIGPKGMLLTLTAPAANHALQAGYVAVAALPLVQRLAHMAVGVVVFAPGLAIIWNLGQLFRRYGQGVVFSADNARRIKRIGVLLILNALAPLASVSVLSALHLAVDHAWLHGDTLSKIVLGGIVWVIAQVMEAGREIEEEREQFV